MKSRIIIAIILIISMLSSVSGYAAIQEESFAEYTWDNVKIGGGGLVSGVLFHPTEENLVYARTDVGGMYRWDNSLEQWIQLNNKFDVTNLYGVDGMAIDPKDADIIYACFGKYTWAEGGVYKSYDRGETWTKMLSVKFAGNSNTRECGECIMVDPNNSNVVYVGTRQSGVYKSNDGGETWSVLKGISSDNIDANFPRTIAFDKRTFENEETQTVYVGIANQGIYKSDDAGYTWENINPEIATPYKMRVNPQNGCLYVATNNGVYKYIDNVWTDITPYRGTSAVYKGMDMLESEPDTLIVSANIGNQMRHSVYVSKDGGDTWVDATKSYTFEKAAKYVEDDNFLPNAVSIAIDPYNSDHVIISDWHGVWETYNIHDKETTNWKQKINGIEEMVPIEVVSPPSGKAHILVSAMDNDGFPITDIYKLQDRKFTDAKLTYGGPRIMATIDLDFCEKYPNIVVRVGITHFSEATGGYSLDGGFTWQPFETDPFDNGKDYPRQAMGAKIALSCDINEDTGYPTLLLNQGNDYPLMISKDMGKTWKVNEKMSVYNKGYYDRFLNRIESDKVIHNKFYAYNKGAIYISEDGGDTWIEGAEVPTEGNNEYFYMKAPFGRKNELWFSSWGKDLLHSVDGGKSFKSIKTAEEVYSFGFGKNAEDSEYPTVFIYGTVEGRKGFYRSTDYGSTWVRIDDDNYKIGNDLRFIEGDRQNFGVVYAVTGGTGLFYGAPKGVTVKPLTTETEDVEVKNIVESVSYSGNKLPKDSLLVENGVNYINIKALAGFMHSEFVSDTSGVIVARDEYNVVFGPSRTDNITHKSMYIGNNNEVTFNGKMVSLNNSIIRKNESIFISLEDLAKIWNFTIKYDGVNCEIRDFALCVLI